METALLSEEYQSAPRFSVLLLDRDGRRCRDRLTALAKSGHIGEAEAAESVETWLHREQRVDPNVLLVSADTFSDQEIADAITSLEQVHPETRLVVADVPDEGGSEGRPVALGAWACVLEGAPFVELLESLSRAANGQATLSGERLGQVILHLQELIRLRPSAPPGSGPLAPLRLTPREREILGLMANRLSNREIAAELCLETGTVKNHVHSVLKKLGLQTRQQAVYYRSREVGLPPSPSLEAQR